MDFGKRLKTFALAVYPEVRDFAADLGTSPSTVSMWFTSKKIPGGEYLQKIYNTGCSIDWLYSGQGQMIADNEAGKKLREKFNLPDSDKSEINSITYERMVQVPFVKDLRVLLRQDIKELLNQYIKEKEI